MCCPLSLRTEIFSSLWILLWEQNQETSLSFYLKPRLHHVLKRSYSPCSSRRNYGIQSGVSFPSIHFRGEKQHVSRLSPTPRQPVILREKQLYTKCVSTSWEKGREMKLNQEENQTKQFQHPGQALKADHRVFVLIFPVTIIHSLLPLCISII